MSPIARPLFLSPRVCERASFARRLPPREDSRRERDATSQGIRRGFRHYTLTVHPCLFLSLAFCSTSSSCGRRRFSRRADISRIRSLVHSPLLFSSFIRNRRHRDDASFSYSRAVSPFRPTTNYVLLDKNGDSCLPDIPCEFRWFYQSTRLPFLPGPIIRHRRRRQTGA